MRTEEPRTIRLSDYRPPDWRVAHVALDFVLDPGRTIVRARLNIAPGSETPGPLVLDGEDLELKSIAVDGAALSPADYERGAETLTIATPPVRDFVLETEVEIAPEKNLELSGLYVAGAVLCTQCEAEGFRRITFFPDRPDVLATYRVRLEADAARYPVLLANGNPAGRGELPGGRHFAEWEDPFPKPSYLFALVAGDLACAEDSFTTRSGRAVAIRVYVEHGKADRVGYAIDSLKRSMAWDEARFGREYDLDIFMIVAVSAFNFGAMENKGLNIYNDKLLLASPQAATDDDYARIEGVVAHEYFHNWTGNRVTCRDWFQLCLKEGLTVYRDQEFSAEMRSAPVRRIEDVRMLRLRQFPEDAGPLAHPVQPQSYIAIDNFYTATVYEKGAEVCRMIERLIGREDFRKGMDLYFERCDGKAGTVEDFATAFEDAAGADLTQFRLWWTQAGTPRVSARLDYDEAAQRATLTLRQTLDATPGQPDKAPMHIPVSLGLIAPDGSDMKLALEGERVNDAPESRTLSLTAPEQVFVFEGITERPTLSLGRGFSAPVHFEAGHSAADLAFLMGRDSDPFNRWEAGQKLATRLILAAAGGSADPAGEAAFLDAFAAVLDDPAPDDATRALAITLPGILDLTLAARPPVDPGALHRAREMLARTIATRFADTLNRIYAEAAVAGPFDPSAAAAGRRALRNAALRYLTAAGDAPAAALALTHFKAAATMTDMVAALGCLAPMNRAERADAFDAFYARFESDPLVVDKWMTLQATAPVEDAHAQVRRLMDHPAFSLSNPNRVRSLVGAFAMSNPVGFHAADGSGYRLLAETALKLDPLNPSVAARILGAFESWKRFDEARQAHARAALDHVLAHKGLSRNSFEIASKTRG